MRRHIPPMLARQRRDAFTGCFAGKNILRRAVNVHSLSEAQASDSGALIAFIVIMGCCMRLAYARRL